MGEEVPPAAAAEAIGEVSNGITYTSYRDETQLAPIMALIDKELSEPYSIFTYRYFITLWPHLCFMASHEGECVGTIVCKMGQHRSTFRGYIAMLVVIKPYRGKGIATELVTRCLQVMRESGCDEVTLEAEVTNKGALALYGNLGFVRAKRLHRYYLNGVDAYRLKLLFPRPQDASSLMPEPHAQSSSMNACQEEGCHDHHDHLDHHDPESTYGRNMSLNHLYLEALSLQDQQLRQPGYNSTNYHDVQHHDCAHGCSHDSDLKGQRLNMGITQTLS
ncbi:N-alpha-acetyltransferase 30 [Marchantia polymorpha subsp. ruderalis]|nr:hypothetical protein MARPO_0127s0038 [Marchantia polymorpha]PTQ30256.1 hypothetical protein MARPO_0127s0038 [Marchantia polymorpha]BBN10908.1 hypothetical protein Mp_5g07460 [Marchantia polymorpha subsp. ruderalis]BBN10909.1 hypothetical protein Mp_5g07460 [Marchantia polymorpha subsp. ruderalis]|eukprot:PTQ30255.1 hypothetical protein MARPO_0127s0038 [Marchantia polymorpha]